VLRREPQCFAGQTSESVLLSKSMAILAEAPHRAVQLLRGRSNYRDAATTSRKVQRRRVTTA
jgi:hypothetical protein